MPGSDSAKLLNPLETVMREAGALARATASKPYKSWNKDHDNSPVSEADLAVNDLLRERLTALAPSAGWLSEETVDSLAARAMARTWIVDPIDGTRAFIQARPDWTVSVALVEDGRPVLAALYAPVTEEMFLAAGGEGASLNGTRIAANGGDTLGQARLAGPRRYLERLAGLEPSVQAQPKVHSLALRLSRVAHGELDAAFAAPGSHDWDLAAADLLVQESGGLLTDFTGRALTYNGPQTVQAALIAAGGARHATLIELMRDRKAEFA